MQAMDVLYAYTESKRVLTNLDTMRESSEKEFKIIFDETSKLGKDVHGVNFALKKPRNTGHQVHRSNILITTVEEYYRIALYNEFFPHITNELKERMVDNPPEDIGYSNCNNNLIMQFQNNFLQ